MIHYQLEFDDYTQHLINVTIRFLANPQQQLWLPTWIPGSYLIREFSKHIENVKAYNEAGLSLTIHKTHKNRWELTNTEHELITVEYQVYAYDLSVRGSYVDQTRIYINPTTVCLGLTDQEDAAHEVEIFLPTALKHFSLAGALSSKSLVKGRYTLKAKNYAHLIDSPFELAQQQQFSFDAQGIHHDFVISGQHHANLDRIKQDLQKICATEIAMFGSAPFEKYTFLTMATGSLYGGLEHCESTSLICPRDDLPTAKETDQPSKNYQRYLGLCSHEYFHAWLVKFIRPENYVHPNLNQEGYTSLLWIFEGFTSYYDDLILARSQVISQEDYLKLLTEQINRYLQNPGRQIQSVSESSFDTWIKFYRQDENSNNAGTSYYNKGALVALCLDLGLRSHGSGLDHVLKTLYANTQKGIQVNERSIFEICKSLTGQDWADRLSFLINSTEELPLDEVLAEFGIDYQVQTEQTLAFGAKIQEKPEGLLLQQVSRTSHAAQAGLSAHDIVVAIDGIKATEAVWKSKAKTQRNMTCHAFRRDEFMQFELMAEEYVLQTVKLQVKDQRKVSQWIFNQ
ncbi:M61 family metallopeptidase [Acinetobacter qingfengensis]|uniref:Serine protease n=1 Tax=Acinetobacter qingfengensis TaxID=1262585 RepID=A0A1E7R1R4_9GAMM|nr:M61 family metallopeptidase [Acinetobacter qingfengensis]KAA8735576.1 M61 family metallopeptidase [Acinetobacter qingfengensis]OEY93258.1 serine protease [Acinetobacter qingfengensis]